MKNHTITLEGNVPAVTILQLSARVLEPAPSLTIQVNGREVFHGKAKRRAAVIRSSLEDCADVASAAAAIMHRE